MANITVSELIINGKTMPTPALEGVTISQEKIWSADTGRTSSGKMAGTIVAVKTTLKIRWNALTPTQIARIEDAVTDSSNPFVPVRYTDMTGKTVTKTMYFGTPSYSLYSWADGRQYIKECTVDAIEQ